MKNYRKIFVASLGTIAIISILSPSLILAQNDNAENNKANGLCKGLSAVASKIDQRIIDRKAKIEAKQEEIAKKIEEGQNRRNAKLEAVRMKWDTNRAEHFAKLEEKAQNDEQKQAVIAFTKAVTTAISARRTIIDRTIHNFRQGVKQMINARKSLTDTAVGTFRDSIKSAFERAQSDCENGIGAKTIQDNLRADIAKSREKFINDHQEITRFNIQTEMLTITKRITIKNAIESFKSAIEQARVDYKTSLTEPEEPPLE